MPDVNYIKYLKNKLSDEEYKVLKALHDEGCLGEGALIMKSDCSYSHQIPSKLTAYGLIERGGGDYQWYTITELGYSILHTPD